MTTTETDDQQGGVWLRVAFYAWALLGLFTAQVVELVGSRLGAPFPCGLCSLPWCEHRAAGHGLLHVVGLAVLWFAWLRAARGPVKAGGWRLAIAFLAPGALLVATALERLVEVETVMATGPILGLIGAPLITPTASRLVRAMGWVCLLTAIVGYDVVVLWRLSPREARDPLFVIGLCGLTASVVIGVLALRSHSRLATPEQ